MSPRLSVIIPVYNTGQFLPACLDSLLSQSFQDFEVLLVDDGSSDGSGVICDEYAQKDNRVKVYHKDNGGVSSARNLGLDNLCGEWVYFVDSDDEIIPGGLQTMVDCISDDVDVVLAGYERYDEQGNLAYSIDERVVTLLSKQESVETLYEKHGKYYDFLTYGWIRLLRNSIIQKFHVRFNTELANKEDTLFLMQYILRSNGITRFTTTPVYKYRGRADSAMGKWSHGFDVKYIDSLYSLIRMKQEVAEHYPLFSNTYFVSQEGIWIRYNRILSRMNALDIHEDNLRETIKKDTYKELGVLFFIRKKMKNTINKWFKTV